MVLILLKIRIISGNTKRQYGITTPSLNFTRNLIAATRSRLGQVTGWLPGCWVLCHFNRPSCRKGKTWSECVNTYASECGLPGIGLQERGLWRADIRYCPVLPTPSNETRTVPLSQNLYDNDDPIWQHSKWLSWFPSIAALEHSGLLQQRLQSNWTVGSWAWHRDAGFPCGVKWSIAFAMNSEKLSENKMVGTAAVQGSFWVWAQPMIGHVTI